MLEDSIALEILPIQLPFFSDDVSEGGCKKTYNHET